MGLRHHSAGVTTATNATIGPGGYPGPDGSADTGTTPRPSIARRVLLSEYLVLVLTAVFVAAILPATDHLLSKANIENILSNYWPLLIVAVGQTFVLIVAGIDLSQTSIMAVANVGAAMIATEKVNELLFDKSPFWGWVLHADGGPLARNGLAVFVAVLVAVVIGVVIGYLNGTAISRLGMPPFMVTLSSLLFFSAVAVWSTRSENISNLPDAYVNLAKGGILPYVPSAALFAIGVCVCGHLTLSRTVIGRQLYSVGANRKASLISGVSPARVITIAYMISGACASIGAVLYSARLEGGRPTLGNNLLLDVIGACVIGGVSLFGGKGKVSGAAMGVLLFVVLANGLNLLRLPFYTVMIVKGGVILLAVFLDVLRTSRRGS